MNDVTVLIPTHPARQHTLLPRAISSVWMQDHPAKALHVEVDLAGRGAPATRHAGLQAVRTEWVAFLDSDDYFYPDHLQVLVDAANEHGADYVYTWFDVIGGADPFPVTHMSTLWDPDNPRHTTITTMVRTDLAQEVGFLEQDGPESPHTGEDWLFTLACNELGKIYHVPNRRTWAWAHHGANTSGRPDRGDAV